MVSHPTPPAIDPPGVLFTAYVATRGKGQRRENQKEKLPGLIFFPPKLYPFWAYGQKVIKICYV